MQNERQIHNILSFGEEILEDIFSRLPVKTLGQLKCVCKGLKTLISTPWFISTHLKRFSSYIDAHYLLFQNKETTGLIPIQNPSCLIKVLVSDYSIIGSINGLVCLTTTNSFHKLICLWNPSMNQFKLIPINLLNIRRKFHVSVGFGYEQKSDDYKVIRILNFYRCRPARTMVEVYSTKLESWREVKTNVCLNNMTTSNCDAIVEGFTYWVIRNRKESITTVLASFDLRNERFCIIPVPQVLATKSHNFRAINYLGSLALLAQSSPDGFNKCLDIWVIEGPSNCEESVWKKKFTFGMDFSFSTHWGFTNGDVVVQNAPNKPFLFNLRTKQLRIIGTDVIQSVFSYTESLVSIKGFNPVPQQ
ncbi:hypothetical protein FXO38_27362 [Capsicum annuum]|nr:hypothetical protein FXO37_30859 [Capsicum annuum]KAF3630086.1 hypothetical protein FXO38_27362 [Capsicum annuum]